MLLLHGTRDSRTTVEHANAVFRALPGTKQLRTFEGAKHEQLAVFDRAGWDASIDELLRSVASTKP